MKAMKNHEHDTENTAAVRLVVLGLAGKDTVCRAGEDRVTRVIEIAFFEGHEDPEDQVIEYVETFEDEDGYEELAVVAQITLDLYETQRHKLAPERAPKPGM